MESTAPQAQIAVLIPVCSRNQQYTDVSSTPFVSRFLPSFKATYQPDKYSYTIFIGYDDDDAFYAEHAGSLAAAAVNVCPIHTQVLTGCQHAPATAWNQLAATAMAAADNFTYFFQVGDDVILERAGWTEYFIDRLTATAGVGVTGPCNWLNHSQRMAAGRSHVIENALVSRRHLEAFGTFFEPSIRNWYCDDWITRIYDGVNNQIAVQFPCRNTIIDCRYTIEVPTGFDEKVARGRAVVAAQQKN
jgi:hypothetical protein